MVTPMETLRKIQKHIPGVVAGAVFTALLTWFIAPAQAAPVQLKLATGVVCNGGQNADGSVDLHCTGLSAPQAPPTTTPPVTTPPVVTTPPATTTPPVTTPPATTPPPTGPVTDCGSHPGACGYPDATTAGAHGSLPAYTGALKFTTAGMSVHDVTITGCPVISAQNVTFTNVVIHCNAHQSYVVDTQGAADSGGVTTMNHVTVVCGPGMHGGTAFGDNFLVVKAADISGCENGGDADNVFTLTASYIHDMFLGDDVATDPHTDGIQVWPGASNIVFTGNTVLMTGANATFTSGFPAGTVAHLKVEGNLLVGGSYIVYCANNVGTLSNNRFGPTFLGTGYPAGYTSNCGSMTRAGNVADPTGLPIPASQLG